MFLSSSQYIYFILHSHTFTEVIRGSDAKMSRGKKRFAIPFTGSALLVAHLGLGSSYK